MRRKAYEIRKEAAGYGVFELSVKGGQVMSETKIVEYDFLIVALSKLMNLLHSTCPEYRIFTNPVPVKDQALPVKDGIDTNAVEVQK